MSTRSAARVVPAPRPHASPASLPYASTVQEPLGNLPGTLLLGGTHVSCPCCRAMSVLRDPVHWPRPWISTRRPRTYSGIDLLTVQPIGTLDDELLAGGDFLAHEHFKGVLRLHDIVDSDPPEHSMPLVHRGLLELIGVHLA